MSQETPETTAQTRTFRDKRVSLMAISGVLALVLGAAALTIPAPYVVESPGPAINTIADFNGKPIITVSGHESYPPAAGSLALTTVHMTGGLPDSRINFFDTLKSWLSPMDTVYPAELIYPPGTSQDTVNSENSAAMTGSQENATAAAMTAMGIDFETNLAVAAVPADGAATGILKPDDVLLTIDGTKVTDLAVIQAALADGKGAPVQLTVRRNDVEEKLSLTPKLGSEGKYLLGVQIQNVFKFPFDVQITLSNIGGPSAGMIFALGIMDSLTPGDLTGGKKFAGTGTIDPKGNVGAIGGIAQKLVGASSTGAEYFLAPAANCGDVVGHIPEGLQVIKVSTLEEAHDAVALIGSGKDGSGLPTCK